MFLAKFCKSKFNVKNISELNTGLSDKINNYHIFFFLFHITDQQYPQYQKQWSPPQAPAPVPAYHQHQEQRRPQPAPQPAHVFVGKYIYGYFCFIENKYIHILFISILYSLSKNYITLFVVTKRYLALFHTFTLIK